jgi:hypothetical protein
VPNKAEPFKKQNEPVALTAEEETAAIVAMMTAEHDLLFALAVEVRILAARAGDDEALRTITDLLTDAKRTRLKLRP